MFLLKILGGKAFNWLLLKILPTKNKTGIINYEKDPSGYNINDFKKVVLYNESTENTLNISYVI